MSNGRPSQKFTKWARRKATTSCGWMRRIDSHIAMARSSSPSDQAVSAATWLRSRCVALEASACAVRAAWTATGTMACLNPSIAK